jgi:hypothetical protein
MELGMGQCQLAAIRQWTLSEGTGLLASRVSPLPYVLNNLGSYTTWLGMFRPTAFRRCSCLCQTGWMTRIEAYTLCSIGDLYAELNEETAAQDAYRQTQSIARKVNDHYLLFYANLVEAAQARRMGEIQRSNDLLNVCHTMAGEDQSDFEIGQWTEASLISRKILF